MKLENGTPVEHSHVPSGLYVVVVLLTSLPLVVMSQETVDRSGDDHDSHQLLTD